VPAAERARETFLGPATCLCELGYYMGCKVGEKGESGMRAAPSGVVFHGGGAGVQAAATAGAGGARHHSESASGVLQGQPFVGTGKLTRHMLQGTPKAHLPPGNSGASHGSMDPALDRRQAPAGKVLLQRCRCSAYVAGGVNLAHSLAHESIIRKTTIFIALSRTTIWPSSPPLAVLTL
jgi:hypothetical protein